MKKSAYALLTLIFYIFIFVLILEFKVAKAEVQTIVVPDDYTTIQESIDAANEGDTIFVKKGIYQEEKMEINKSISLMGEDAEETEIYFVPPLVDKQILGGIIQVRSTAFLVNADEVTISGFTLNSKEYVPIYDMEEFSANGDGINFIDNIIGNNFILDFKGDRLTVIGNTLSSGLRAHGPNQNMTRNEMHGLLSYGNYSKIYENKIDSFSLHGSFNLISGNSLSTMKLWDAHSNLITNNTFTFLHVGYQGLACTNNTISKNSIVGPDKYGIFMNAGSNNLFHDNVIYNYTDGYGVAIGGHGLVAENNIFYRNIFVNNELHVSAYWDVLGVGNFWDNGEQGNYWDNYTGFDRNKDGIGDIPYMVKGYKREYEVDEEIVVDELVSFAFGVDNYPLMFPFDLEDFSVELPDEIQLLPPYLDSTLFSGAEIMIGVTMAAAVIGFSLGLIIYLVKKKTVTK